MEIFGIRAVMEAINSSKDIDKVFIQIGLKGSLINTLESVIRKNKINFSYVPKQKLDRLSKKNHQGVIARVSPIKLLDLNQIDTIIREIKSPLLLILDQINDVRNFGAIIRTAEVAGVAAVVIQNSSSAPINSDTIKTSAGAIFNIPIFKVDHIKDAIFLLKANEIKIVSADEKGENSIYDYKFDRKTSIIMGSEGKGISKSILSLSDNILKIPMKGKVESLNVSVATGIFISELAKQL